MRYRIATQITTEPISLAEAKLHLRITADETSEDGLVNGLISAAREFCEEFTGRALATQTIEAFFDNFPDKISLPRPPLQSVTSVKYKDSAGAETTMTVTTDYLVNTDSEIAEIVLPYSKTWPTFIPYPINPIKVTYTAGYYSTNPMPKSIEQAMMLLIGHWYANREALGNVGGQIEFAVKALLSNYRVRWWD